MLRFQILFLCLFVLLQFSGCGKRLGHVSSTSPKLGFASWYGDDFHGRKTASGETYDMHAFTAAHRHASFGTMVRVTHLKNGRTVVVRINDRGPFVRGRIIDLSFAAAKELDLIQTGTAKVRLDFLGMAQSSSNFFIQVGSFQEISNAQRMLDMVHQRFPGQPGRIETSEGLHRIWLGPLENEAAAMSLTTKLEGAGYPAFILRR